MKKLILKGIVVGPVCTNCYFLKNEQTQEILIVDPGAEQDRIVFALEQLQGKPIGILLTHGHYDHICAVNELKEQYQIPVYAGKDEEKLLRDTNQNLSAVWSDVPYKVKADVLLEDGEKIQIAGFEIMTIFTPGHTKGSCCYWLTQENVCLSGDTVFYGNCGRCDLPTGSMSQMKESLNKIFTMLPEDTVIYPGHGEETDVEFEKKNNPYL